MPRLTPNEIEDLKLQPQHAQAAERQHALWQCDSCVAVYSRSRTTINKTIARGLPLLCDICQKTTRVEARKATMLERFGTAGVLQTDAVLAKRRATNIERYGGAAPQASAAVRDKTKATVQARYGVGSVSQVPEIRARAVATMNDRLGVPYAMMATQTQDKSKATCLERYGVLHNTQSDVMKNKSAATRTERYGAPWPGQSGLILEKIRTTNFERYGGPAPTSAAETVRKGQATKLKNYGTLTPGVYGAVERSFADKFKEWGLDVGQQHVLNNGKTLDVVIESKKFAFEYCGLFWHNEHSPEPRGPTYHADKMRAANAEGWRLVTLFEDAIAKDVFTTEFKSRLKGLR